MKKLRAAILALTLLLALPVAAQHKELRKMSPLLRARCMRALRGDANDGRMVYAFVKSNGDAADLFAENGCETLAAFGDIQILCIPERSLSNLARDERIERIEAGRTASVTNDRTAELLGATAVHAGTSLPQSFTGNGVIVGVQDIGFDLTNPNFYSKDLSRFRIKRFWDMLASTSQIRPRTDSRLAMGKEYTDSAELIALAHSRDALTCLHGSHTLGTAAGSGYNSPYAGISFDADICLVDNVTSENKSYLETANELGSALTALGFKYIFDYADEQGKPCVISFSEGSLQDFTEDNLLYYETLAEMVGEGRIIVASAGNKSQTATYICKPEGKDAGGAFMQNSGDELYFMAQGTADFDVRITVYGNRPVPITINSAALLEYPDSIFCDTLVIDDTPYILQRVAYPSAFSTTNIAAEYALSGPKNIGRGTAPVSVELIGEEAEIEAYSLVGEFVENDINPLLADEETSHNVLAPGAAPAVIAVGATAYVTEYENMFGDTKTYDYGTDGTRAAFSSVGPTLDGRTKPDVMAPGTNIVSSTNSFYFEANPDADQWNDLVGSCDFGDRTYYWKADTGTSMSTPFVAGIIALWLEAKPDLTREEILDAFAATCTHPDASLDYPNNLYGYGQIDAYKGLLFLLGLDKIKDISSRQPAGVKIGLSPDNDLHVAFEERLDGPAKVKIYSVGGQLLQTFELAAGIAETTVPLTAAARGIIAVQINAPTPSCTGSFLLRR